MKILWKYYCSISQFGFFYFLYYFFFFHFTFTHTKLPTIRLVLFFFFFFSSTRSPLSLPLFLTLLFSLILLIHQNIPGGLLSPAPSLLFFFFFFFFNLIPKLSPIRKRFHFLCHLRTFQGALIFVLLLIFVPNPVQMGQQASVLCLFFFFAFIVMIWLILKLCFWVCILVIWLCLRERLFIVMICNVCSVVFVLCLFMGISGISSLATVTIKTRSARFHLWTVASPFSFRVLPSVFSKSSKRNFYKKVAFWAYQTQNWVELFWKSAFWASNAEPNEH